jgi:DNA polymerase-3 subunit chi
LAQNKDETASGEGPEVLFYHLERLTLERMLPQLLERTLERGWRAVLQVGNPERLEALDAHLWTYGEGTFLAHGTRADGHPDRQPIYLTTEQENPNAATVCFLVDGAAPAAYAGSGYDRFVVIFDGRDPDALDAARLQWRRAKAEGCRASYWQQGERGRWEQKA